MVGDLCCTILLNGSHQHFRCFQVSFSSCVHPLSVTSQSGPPVSRLGWPLAMISKETIQQSGEARVTCWRECSGRCPGAWLLQTEVLHPLGQLGRHQSVLEPAEYLLAVAGDADPAANIKGNTRTLKVCRFLTAHPLLTAVSEVSPNLDRQWPADTRLQQRSTRRKTEIVMLCHAG